MHAGRAQRDFAGDVRLEDFLKGHLFAEPGLAHGWVGRGGGGAPGGGGSFAKVAHEVGGAGFPSLACVDATKAEAVLP